MVDLLDVGDRIDLVATDPRGGGTQVVAAGVPVLALPAPAPEVVAGGSRARSWWWAWSPPSSPPSPTRGVRQFLTYAFSPSVTAHERIKNFILRGNLVELAVAVIVATSFTAVVATFTDWLTAQMPESASEYFSNTENSFGAFLNAVSRS